MTPVVQETVTKKYINELTYQIIGGIGSHKNTLRMQSQSKSMNRFLGKFAHIVFN